ncbi:MAG TPA: hypothetical protein VNE42_10070 [Acidimicrobiales bacterium]|nr:hypothetical protein [Acidimicrobiales bacterium]
MSADLQTLEEAISGLLDGIDVDLVDVELRQGALCVTVSHRDGLDLESLTHASRLVSDFLDAHEELTPTEPFELEVSSPGLERRLRRPQHFAKAIGQVIAVRTINSAPGERRDEGQLVRADELGIALLSNDSKTLRELTYEMIDRAHTVFDWKAALAQDKRARMAETDQPEGLSGASDGRDNTSASTPQRENER